MICVAYDNPGDSSDTSQRLVSRRVSQPVVRLKHLLYFASGLSILVTVYRLLGSLWFHMRNHAAIWVIPGT
jgi:hypothetical protein